MRATKREDIMSWASNSFRIMASAAALILFGFTVGWLGKDRYGVPIVSHPSQNAPAVVTAGSTGSQVVGTKYNVEIRDRSGKLVAPIQQFDSEADARQFIHDLQAAQSSQGGELNVVPAVNKF